MIKYLGLVIAVILALFFRHDSGVVVKIGCIVSMGVLAWLLFRMSDVEHQPEQKPKKHKTQKMHIEYICNFTTHEGADVTPIVSGEFDIMPVLLSFQPESKDYKYLTEMALQGWLNGHFSFTYKVKTEGENFNGTFKPAGSESRTQGKES